MRQLFLLCLFLLAPAVHGGNMAEQAESLFDSDWQWQLEHHPEFATSIGDERFDAMLADTSLAESRAATAQQRKMLDQARAIERDKLDPSTRLSLDVFIVDKEQALKMAALYPYTVQPISAYSGIHVTLPQLVAQMPFATEAHYRHYIARLAALPRHVDGIIEQLRENVRTGWTAPQAVIRPLPAMLRQLREEAVDGALGQPLRQVPATIDKPVREELVKAGMAALQTQALPALQALEDYLRNEYLPAARASIGAAALPGGADYYAALAARYTGGALAPAQLHALGLKEVARLRGELTGAIARTGFTGNFTAFAAFANSDKRLFYRSGEAALERYRRIVARAEAGLPRLFTAMPRQALSVRAAPAPGALERGAAWYDAGGADRPAAFVVNTTRLDSQPMWEMEALALHEALPGHHLQVWLARENAALPAFRRYAFHPAFGEGWALYAESLGPELGFYRDPFSAFGYLNSRLFRAARTVVDTGIHALGWSRQQALDYLNANTANSLADNAIEVDRYIAWPGQALAYQAGAMRIRALREKAEATLGERFDVRRFHAAVLEQGALPLPLLDRHIEAWIAATLAMPADAAAPVAVTN